MLVFCYHHFWQWSIDLARYFGFDHKNEILLSGICMFVINVIYDTIDLPLKIYNTFVIEQKHGFNKEVDKNENLISRIVGEFLFGLLCNLSISDAIVFCQRSASEIHCLPSDCDTSPLCCDMDRRERRGLFLPLPLDLFDHGYSFHDDPLSRSYRSTF